MLHRSSSVLFPLWFLGLAAACGGGGESDAPVPGSGGQGGSSASSEATSEGSSLGGGESGGAPAGSSSTSSAGDVGDVSGSVTSGGGATSSTGVTSTGDVTSTGGAAGSSGGSTAVGDCSFSLVTNEVSSGMATVGVVEWAVDGTPTQAKLVYELEGAADGVLNRGGEAPVDLTRENYRTLLLGLKQNASYSFFIEATVDGEPCVSGSYSLPETGTLSGAPTFSVTVDTPEAREPGFIVTSTGYAEDPDNDTTAFIIDSDGDIVWAAPAPPDAARAKLDYEGENMWMLGLNFGGGYGEMRYLSMDGQTGQKDIEGLEAAHHDFAVMPGGKVAVMAWTELSIEGPESELLIRSPDGTIETAFLIGENLYLAPDDRFHCNAVHYLEEDDSFTISDRYASAIVKVSSDGELLWQLGGSCGGAPAGPDKCSAQSWNANHGHHLMADGSLLIFNNTPREGGDNSNVLEFDLAESESSMTASLVKDYAGTTLSGILGDVQRLPGGNTLITYSDASQIVEVDADWQIVQTFDGSVGYAEWRPTLYGPPLRL